MRRMIAAAALGLLAAGLSAGVAQAGEGEQLCSTGWVAQDWPQDTPQPAAQSTVHDWHVVLVKSDPATGTDASTADLGLTGQVLSVQYELSGGAETTAGAVRFFAYQAPDADTSAGGGQAPAQVDIAEGASGTLTLDFGAAVAIGTTGVTFDASNASTGTVVFSSFTLDGKPLALTTGPCQPADEPGDEPGDEPTDEPTDEPSTPAAGKGAGELPKTGTPLPLLTGAGVLLMVAGGVGLVTGRRRRIM